VKQAVALGLPIPSRGRRHDRQEAAIPYPNEMDCSAVSSGQSKRGTQSGQSFKDFLGKAQASCGGQGAGAQVPTVRKSKTKAAKDRMWRR